MWDLSGMTNLETQPTSDNCRSTSSGRSRKGISIKETLKTSRPMTSNTERKETMAKLKNLFSKELDDDNYYKLGN